MSNLSVNTITNAAGGNTAQINGMTPTGLSLQGFRNRIINGDMRIDQRNNGAAITVPTVNPGFAVDRFQVDQAADSVLTVQQTTDAPEGFTNSLRITVATPDASIGAAQYVQLQHNFEGFNTADLGWGTANAKTVTLSFWVNSSVTGQYPVRLVNNGGSRSYPFYVTINTANTWEFKTATIVGPTNGTFPINNTQSFGLGISLAVGSNFAGATPNIWNSTTSFLAANIANNTGFIATTGATFQITGVQLEAGSVATPFERRPYGTELALCQRYFCTSTLNPATDTWYLDNGGFLCVDMEDLAMGGIRWPVEMRATPTVVGYAAGVTNAIKSWGGNATRNITGYRLSRWGWNGTAHDGGYNLGRPYTCTWTASAEL